MECFSLGILESLAANVPVITTNVGGNEEAVKGGINGYIFNAKDVNKLSRLLDELWTGKKTIQQNVSTYIRMRFTIEEMVNKHVELI
jgi:glycosyltransferase involved in cell wall biosynthesis